MATDADGGANAGRETEGFAFGVYLVVELAELGTGLDPSGLGWEVDGDGPEVEHVEDNEGLVGDVGDSVVVVAAAADFELDVDGLGAEDGV